MNREKTVWLLSLASVVFGALFTLPVEAEEVRPNITASEKCPNVVQMMKEGVSFNDKAATQLARLVGEEAQSFADFFKGTPKIAKLKPIEVLIYDHAESPGVYAMFFLEKCQVLTVAIGPLIFNWAMIAVGREERKQLAPQV